MRTADKRRIRSVANGGEFVRSRTIFVSPMYSETSMLHIDRYNDGHFEYWLGMFVGGSHAVIVDIDRGKARELLIALRGSAR